MYGTALTFAGLNEVTARTAVTPGSAASPARAVRSILGNGGRSVLPSSAVAADTAVTARPATSTAAPISPVRRSLCEDARLRPLVRESTLSPLLAPGGSAQKLYPDEAGRS